VNRIHFSITCKRCGGSLTNVNNAQPSSMEAVAVLACVPCRARFSIRVHMVDLDAERIIEGNERLRNVATRRELARVAS
jgi:hypothetical protein